MNVAELKTNLIQLVMDTDNPTMLEKVIHFIKDLRKKEDWWADLTEKQKIFIEKSSQQIDEGNVIPNEEVRNEIRQILQKR